MARNVPTEIILLQIAEGLQSLARNPDLGEKVKDLYALNEAEQAKYDTALATIAKADQIAADQKKREDAIADINVLLAKEEAIKADNAQAEKELAAQSIALTQQAAQNAKDADDNAKEEIRLQNVSAALDARAEALQETEAQLAEDQADLNKRIALIKRAGYYRIGLKWFR